MVQRSHSGRIPVLTPTIMTATAADADPGIAALTLAFCTDPGVRWTYPDPQQYLQHFPSLVQAFRGGAFTYGSAYYVDGYAGAALWLPPGVAPDDAMHTLLQHTVPEPGYTNLLAVFEQISPYLPRTVLVFAAHVDPFHQGKGYGAALMQHALLACDRDHTLAYLESTNRRTSRSMNATGLRSWAPCRWGRRPPSFPCSPLTNHRSTLEPLWLPCVSVLPRAAPAVSLPPASQPSRSPR